MGVTVREKKRGSGTWWVFINHQGRRRSISVGTRRDAEAVADRVRMALAERRLGIMDETVMPTLAEYAAAWLDGYVRHVNAPRTYQRYSGILRDKIVPALGRRKLDEITRTDVRDLLIREHAAGSSRSSIGLLLCVISGAYRQAMDDDIVTVNPAAGVSIRNLGRPGSRRDVNPLSRSEAAAVLEVICNRWPDLYPFFLTAFRTGARLGELCALQWSDVDFRRRTITIRRTAKDQHVRDMTKTYRGRDVDMTDQLHAMLTDHHATDMTACREAGIRPKWVFHRGGRLLSQQTIRRRWNDALAAAGIDHHRLHDIRHTFASQLLEAGAPVTYVSHQLGHSSPHITMTVYAHFIPSDNRELINTLDDPRETGYKAVRRIK